MDTEQHFILRVQNAELANRLRGWLRDAENIDGNVRLLFDKQGDREGELTVDGVQHRVLLQDLPTVVESYKTLDDANLVKVADIGQVLLVVDPEVGPEEPLYIARDGVTPPMRKARSRHFKPPITLPAAPMYQAVRDAHEILMGRAPESYAFVDIEEEYVVDANGVGRWQTVKPAKQQRAAAAAATAVGDGGGGAGGAAKRGAGRAPRGRKHVDSDSEGDLEMTDSG